MTNIKASVRKNVPSSKRHRTSQHSVKETKKQMAELASKYVFPMTITNTYNENKYTVTGIQRQGKFGGIFVVTDKVSNETKSIKFGLSEHYQVEIDVLTTCAELLPDTDKICKFLDYGFIDSKNEPFILLENLSMHLGEYVKTFPHEKFDTTTGMNVLMECLKCIHFLHGIGFVHRNIKPSSFYIELNEDKSIKRMYIADFEGAQRLDLDQAKIGNMNTLLKDLYTRRLKERTCGLKYCPLRQHTASTPIPKDDLESWFYLGIDLLEGTLPWIKYNNNEEEKVVKAKQKMREPNNPFFKHTPIRFASLLPRIDDFGESAPPDYNFLMARLEKYHKYLITDDKAKVELSKDRYIEEAEKNRKEEIIEKIDVKGKDKKGGSVKGEKSIKGKKK
uniref:Protein kinase domain-containing protein n=1 Tax=Parastrongyloides trichosuri TaxID=131310 RepID=A0A0N4ZUB2_PARTI